MRLCYGLALSLLSLLAAAAVGPEHDEGIKLNRPHGFEWRDGPPSLPKGAQIAVLEGDPSKEGPFVFRVKAPDGYRIPVHTHPKTERVTVISGTFNIGMGDKFDQAATEPMPAPRVGEGRNDRAVSRPRPLEHSVRESGGRSPESERPLNERLPKARDTKV